MENMITDRTNLDVQRWKLLRDKGWMGMTRIERQEWLGEIQTVPSATKGMYTHNDLNRVERAVEIIVDLFKDAGYKVPDMVIKTDWTYRDTITREDMVRYYSNIETLRSFLVVYPGTPKTPTINRKLDYELANNIEKILVDVHSIVTNIMNTWYYAGEYFSGEV